MEWTTLTEQTYFVNIKDSDGNFGEGFHNKEKHFGYFAHDEMIEEMKKCKSLEEYKKWLNNWADEHVVLAVNDGENHIKTILAYGREALPEGLRLPMPSDEGISNLDVENKPKSIDVSPKGDCGS